MQTTKINGLSVVTVEPLLHICKPSRHGSILFKILLIQF